MAEGTPGSKLVRQFSAGGAVFKRSGERVLWLIIKPANADRWQLPKGRIEKDESSETAALREAGEEGGVEVRAVSKIGNQQYFFVLDGKRIFKIVTFYLMEHIADNTNGHDGEVDEALFLPFDEAINKLTFKNDKEILNKAKTLLAEGEQQTLV